MNHFNQHIRITAATLGTLLGLSGGINHGVFEIMQGNTPTGSFFIEAIGTADRFWPYGTEGAVTVIPNFLLTGITVLLVSLAVIIWSLKYLQVRHGSLVFLLLMLTLTLVGGGIGHIVLFLPVWGYTTRISKPLSWWRRGLSTKVRNILLRLWKPMLVLATLSWLMVMELGIFGYFPRQNDPDVLLNITFGFVLLTVVLANIAFICAIAWDTQGDEAYRASL